MKGKLMKGARQAQAISLRTSGEKAPSRGTTAQPRTHQDVAIAAGSVGTVPVEVASNISGLGGFASSLGLA